MSIAILGAGPHGRQIAGLLSDDDLTPVLFDDDRDQHPHLLDTVEGAKRWPWVAGQAWPAARRALVERIYEHRVLQPKGAGIVLWPGVKIGTEAEIGHHAHLGYNVVVSHGCRVGDYALICAGAVLGGDVTLEPEVVIGSNATIIHGGLTIGEGALIGAGTVVVDDVAPGAVVAGNPGKVLAHEWHYTDMAEGRRRGARLASP